MCLAGPGLVQHVVGEVCRGGRLLESVFFITSSIYVYIYGALGCPMILPSMLCLACFMNELFVELMNEAG